jgi:hypothetical protein
LLSHGVYSSFGRAKDVPPARPPLRLRRLRGAVAMRNVRYLMVAVGEGAFLLTLAAFALGIAAVLVFGPSRPPATPSPAQVVALATVILLPVGTGAWWIFRKLRSRWQRREALAVAISFAVFSPLSLVVAIPLAMIPGGYAGYLGRPFGSIGAFLSIVLMLWLATFLPSAFILWLLRRA